MPRDNHPRQRQARQLSRKQGTRPPYSRVLIVAEGEKTEPQYFTEIRQQERLPSAHVAIMNSAYGTEPRQIVDFAMNEFRKRDGALDRVFVVFDRDEHRTYHEALKVCSGGTLTNDERKRVKLEAIVSNPCFEFWLLLHFENVRELFHRDEIFEKLKRYLPSYEKACVGVYKATQDRLDDAEARAKLLRDQREPEADKDGPYTNVDVIVALLLSMKN